MQKERSLTCPQKNRVHRFDLRMTADQSKLERFLNSLEGEIITIIPNVTVTPFVWASRVDFAILLPHTLVGISVCYFWTANRRSGRPS
jgi:hypothetical protein